jgi:hypothetical protein
LLLNFFPRSIEAIGHELFRSLYVDKYCIKSLCSRNPKLWINISLHIVPLCD